MQRAMVVVAMGVIVTVEFVIILVDSIEFIIWGRSRGMIAVRMKVSFVVVDGVTETQINEEISYFLMIVPQVLGSCFDAERGFKKDLGQRGSRNLGLFRRAQDDFCYRLVLLKGAFELLEVVFELLRTAGKTRREKSAYLRYRTGNNFK